MPLINDAIPQQQFELIRDKIAAILTVEIANQYSLTGENALDTTIWLERFVPFSQAELPGVVISLDSCDYITNSTIHSQGEYTFFIDVYTKAKNTDSERAYLTALKDLHRVLGVIRYILEDPQYRALEFPRPSVSRTEVEGFVISDPKNNQDGASGSMAHSP